MFEFPAELVLTRMVPGTAIGVLAGDLVSTWLALRLARETGRGDVTAMPFGIDTPTRFAMVFGVLGPVKIVTGDPGLAWKVRMAVTIAIGLVKTVLSFAGESVRRVVPRAALLGSIGGIAIVLMVLWGSALAFIVDRKFAVAGIVFSIASGAALFGLIHSPIPSGSLFWPWAPPSAAPARFAGAYGILASLGWLTAGRARR